MGIGVVGTIRPADVSVNDISVYYNYSASRETSNTIMYDINASDVLSYCYLPTADQIANNENLLEGLYDLTLPSTIFNQLGIYTIYIKPLTITTTIFDCGVLSAMPTTKGLVLDSTLLPQSLKSNNALQGYRIEYINSDGTKLRNVSRYVVTSNKAVAVTENVGTTQQKATRYRLDDSGSLLFLQLTPTSSSEIKPNVLPFIGIPTQTIIISNTFFNPITIEVEMVENDLQTLADALLGEQIKDVENGILTDFDSNRNIVHQWNLYTIKDSITNTQLYEVKEKRTDIDTSQNFDTINTP
jgi:hypothetical protein